MVMPMEAPAYRMTVSPEHTFPRPAPTLSSLALTTEDTRRAFWETGREAPLLRVVVVVDAFPAPALSRLAFPRVAAGRAFSAVGKLVPALLL